MSNNDPQFSDEELSAFLDSELDAPSMERIRDAIAEDDSIAERIESLASADALAQVHLRSIDDVPMSPSLKALVAQLEAGNAEAELTASNTESNNIVQFPVWKRVKQQTLKHAAMAACLVVAVGFVVLRAPQSGNNELNSWAQISTALDTKASGEMYLLDDGSRFEARLSFFNQSREYCRQFYVNPIDARPTQSIACQIQGSWKLEVELPTSQHEGSEYQTASSNPALDAAIDALIDGDFLTPAQEQQAIQSSWEPLSK